MSAITTILTTTLAAIGAATVAKHLKKRLNPDQNLKNRQARKASGRKEEVIEMAKDPETGIYQRK